MIAAVVVHFGAIELTQRCLDSVLADTRVPDCILVMDNGGIEVQASDDLKQRFAEDERVQFLGNGINQGFASACNAAFEELLSIPNLEAVFLVNNDCELASGFVSAMLAALDPADKADMVAARMVTLEQPETIDSMGVVLYSCGIAANRKDEDEPLLGPCGGAALYSARLLRDLRARTGQYFESRYFCYAEDTDLAIRARLLGYRAAYASDAVARHVGSAASGGSDSAFVMYHGLRNSFSTLARCLPAGFFLRFGAKLMLLQFMLAAKYLHAGRFGLLLRVWRDALREVPASLRMRARLRRTGVLHWKSLADVVDRRFYQRDYLSRQARRLFGAGAERAGT